MKKICFLLLVVCLSVSMLLFVAMGSKHGQYVAQCEFECCRDSGRQGDTRADIWLVKEYLEWFKKECTPNSLTERFLQRSVRNVGDAILASNTFASCSLSLANSTAPKVVLVMSSPDSSLAKEATTFLVESFSNWLDRNNRLAFEKNTARLRVEAERCRRKGVPIDPQIDEALSEARKRMKDEEFHVGAIGEIRCRRIDAR